MTTHDIKRRLYSTKNTAQITRAMQLISATKMRRARERTRKAQAYAQGAEEILRNLYRSNEGVENPIGFTYQKGPQILSEKSKKLIILLTTDRGFCGGLNINLFNILPREKTEVLTIGRKGWRFAKRENIPIASDFPSLRDDFLFDDVLPISKFGAEAIRIGKYNEVFILFNHFQSTLSYKPILKKLLPIEFDLGVSDKNRKIDYIFEPSPEKVFEELVPHLVETQIYKAFLDAIASEHSARMMAMRNATDRAREIIEDLSLEYNHARQAAITKEISEIVGGGLNF